MNQGGGGAKEVGKWISSLKAQIYQCPRCRLMKWEDRKLRQAAEENQATGEKTAEGNQAAGKQADEKQAEIKPDMKPEPPQIEEPEIDMSENNQAAEENQAAGEQAAEKPKIEINEETKYDLTKLTDEEYFKLTLEQEQILNLIFAPKK